MGNFNWDKFNEINESRMEKALEQDREKLALLQQQDIKDAARYRYLREKHSYRYGMTQDGPMECGIAFEFQQSAPHEAGMSLDDIIDREIAVWNINQEEEMFSND